MSWKKRPDVIKKDKISLRIPYHIAIDEITSEEDRGEAGSVVDEPERILTGDLDYE